MNPAKAASGLSPRVRGSRNRAWSPPAETGPIPAGAGEPPYWRSSDARQRAYPRGCGGAADRRVIGAVNDGLSPRVRGSRGRDRAKPGDARPIPAGAGEPDAPVVTSITPTAYPRGCGGAQPAIMAPMVLGGLSPRVRGSPNECSFRAKVTRPIPAGAGEPRSAMSTRARSRAYPRGCGGAGAGRNPARSSRGLSPRVRRSPNWRPL